MASKANRKLNKKKIVTQNLPAQEVDWNVYFSLSKEESKEEPKEEKKEKVALECGDKCHPKYDSDDDSDDDKSEKKKYDDKYDKKHDNKCDKKSEFDCEDYLRRLIKNHYSTLRVAFALGPDATLPANCPENGNGNGENGAAGNSITVGRNANRANNSFNISNVNNVTNITFDQNGFVVPSLGINSSLLWQNFYLSLLTKVASYVKGIKNIQVITTRTPQEALDLLAQGQVALVASPQPITRALLEKYAAIGVSGVNITRVLLAFEGIAIEGETEPFVLCPDATLVNELNELLGEENLATLTFEELASLLTDAIAATENNFIIIVNTEEQEEYLNENFGIPLENIVVDPTVPQCPEQLSALLNKYAPEEPEGFEICNIVYFGYYPVDCPAAAVAPPTTEFTQDDVDNETVFLFGTVVTLPPQLQSNAFGWVLPQWANNLQLWLQLAYDQVINDLRNKGHKHKKNPLGGFYPDGKSYSSGFCQPANNTFGTTFTSTSTGFPPVRFPVGAFGTNVSYSGCFPTPFIPLCPQFSLCQHYIPAAAVYEVFLPELQCLKKPGKVSIGGSC